MRIAALSSAVALFVLALNSFAEDIKLTNISFKVESAPYSHGGGYFPPRFTNGAIVYQTNAPKIHTITASNFPTLGLALSILEIQGVPVMDFYTPYKSYVGKKNFYNADKTLTNWTIGFTALDTNLNIVRATALNLTVEPFENFFLIGYKSNTVQELNRQSMSNLFTGFSNGSPALQYWSTNDLSEGVYVRNSECLLSNLDMTGISPMRFSGGSWSQGYSAAIGRKHIAAANHIGWWSGMQVAFFDATNGRVVRTIATNHVVNTDLMIGVLDCELPESIRHFKVLPNLNIWAIFPYIPDFNGDSWKGTGVPCFGINQSGRIFIKDHQQDATLANRFYHAPNVSDTFWFPDLSYSIHGGDSSTPVFSVLGTNVIYWGGWFFPWEFPIAGAGNTDSISNAVGTNFLDPVDLSEFMFPEVESNDFFSGESDPDFTPSINSTLYINRANGSVFHWNSTKTNWLKIIGP